MSVMTTASQDLTPLRSAVSAPVLGPGDDGWDSARQAQNLTADQQPAAVAFADNADGVAAVVNFAHQRGLRLAAQTTGHAARSLGPLDGVVLLKTERMKSVSVDPGARRARVEAGVLSGELGPAAGEHGLTSLGGSSPTVGVVGFAVGGGIGWLSRRHGLTCNTITAVELVTADGEQVRADAEQNADLFWALRGGGGDFGVVTALELELFPIERVYAGSLMWPAEHAKELLPAYLEWLRTVPDELTTGFRFLRLPPIPDVPEPLRGVPVFDVTGAFIGDAAAGAALLDPLRSLATPLIDGWDEIPATGLSRINGDPEEPVPGLTHHRVVGDLGSEAADALMEVAGPDSGTPLVAVGSRHLSGALASAPAGAGALSRVEGEHVIVAVGVAMEPAMAETIDTALDTVVEAVEPWATGGDYLNFADRPGDASKAFDAQTLGKLREIKASVDPDGMFVAVHPVDRA
jgi:FAD/FMN-containing dehydrogenase